MPDWFAALFMLCILSASMSTLSSQFHTMGASVGSDIYKVWDDFIHIFDCFRSYNTFGLKKEKIAQCTCMINSTYGNNQKKTPDKNPTV